MLCVLFSLLGKIEVKILTRKNIEEAGDQWLTEEDTKSFRELLINLLVTKITVTFYRVYLKSWSVTFCTVGLCLSVCVYLIVLIYCMKIVCDHRFLISPYRLEALKRFTKSKKGSRSWRTTTTLCGESPKRNPRLPALLIQMMWTSELVVCRQCTFSNRQLLWRLAAPGWKRTHVVQKLRLNLAGDIKWPVWTFRKYFCVSSIGNILSPVGLVLQHINHQSIWRRYTLCLEIKFFWIFASSSDVINSVHSEAFLCWCICLIRSWINPPGGSDVCMPLWTLCTGYFFTSLKSVISLHLLQMRHKYSSKLNIFGDWFNSAVGGRGVCELAVALYIFQLVSHQI